MENVIVVRHLGDTQFCVDVRGHEVALDLPPEAGGRDEGPTPTELFVAALASGTAFYARSFLHSRGLPDRVDVTARWRFDSEQPSVSDVHLELWAPGLTSKEVAELRRLVKRDTVHKPCGDHPTSHSTRATRCWGRRGLSHPRGLSLASRSKERPRKCKRRTRLRRETRDADSIHDRERSALADGRG